jgi:hypothetical protein
LAKIILPVPPFDSSVRFAFGFALYLVVTLPKSFVLIATLVPKSGPIFNAPSPPLG